MKFEKKQYVCKINFCNVNVLSITHIQQSVDSSCLEYTHILWLAYPSLQLTLHYLIIADGKSQM